MADVADPEAEGRIAGDAWTNLSGVNDLENAMTANQTLDPLILDLLEWIAREPRSHADVIEAWRTSCPRLTVWEDAVDRGFAAREPGRGRDVLICLTAAGQGFLREHGRSAGEGIGSQRPLISMCAGSAED
jgi:hypothetical protein